VDLVTGVGGIMAGIVIISRGGVALEDTLEAGSFSGGSSPFRQRTEFPAGMLTPHLKTESSNHTHRTLKTRLNGSTAQDRMPFTSLKMVMTYFLVLLLTEFLKCHSTSIVDRPAVKTYCVSSCSGEIDGLRAFFINFSIILP
jgi:hypothetical protein